LLLTAPAPADGTQTSQKTAPSSQSATSKTKTNASGHRARSKKGASKKGAWKRHGQQEIQPERASAIQQALIREKYLAGDPNGHWDARTQAAMARYQSDHGWQSKVTPDSRALIKLGLGPDYSEKNMMLFVPKASPDSGAASATASSAPTSKQP
jgi:peptidoglycan hydrolase-like protein with peptidoglycan-binding domain